MSHKKGKELQGAICYAQKMGYKTAIFRMKWKGYDVYEPIYSNNFACIGLPLMVLEKNGNFRMTTSEEVFELLDMIADTDNI